LRGLPFPECVEGRESLRESVSGYITDLQSRRCPEAVAATPWSLKESERLWEDKTKSRERLRRDAKENLRIQRRDPQG
jgi:hypothetical protein